MIPLAPFFLKIVLAIQSLLNFHTNCEIFCSSSVKEAIGNLIGIALNLYIAFDNIVFFTILSLPTKEHGTALHLFMSSLISSVSCSFCILYSFSFVSLGKFTPKWFICRAGIEKQTENRLAETQQGEERVA